MRTIWRLLGDHRAVAIAVLALYLTARGSRRLQHATDDNRALSIVLAVDAGLVAWAIWDEVTRRRRHDDR